MPGPCRPPWQDSAAPRDAIIALIVGAADLEARFVGAERECGLRTELEPVGLSQVPSLPECILVLAGPVAPTMHF